MSCRPLLSPAELEESDLQHDMVERGRRLAAFKAATENRVWFQSKNGEWWLVSAYLTKPAANPSVRNGLAMTMHGALQRLCRERAPGERAGRGMQRRGVA